MHVLAQGVNPLKIVGVIKYMSKSPRISMGEMCALQRIMHAGIYF